MMETKTRVEPTVAGDVEYQVVECDGCGHETALENVTMAVLVKRASHRDRYHRKNELRLKGNPKNPYRVFCPECSDVRLDHPKTYGYVEPVAEHLTGRRDMNPWIMYAFLLVAFALGVFAGVTFL